MVKRIVVLLCALAGFVVPTFAEDLWKSTTSGTFSWTDTTRWSNGAVPGNEDVRITNNISSGLVITNAGQGSSTINFLAISNNTAGTTTVIQQSNTVWTLNFGVQLGINANLILTTNATFGSDVNNTFDLAAGGQKGTLSLSNAANVAAFTLFLDKGTANTANTNAVVNAGTIQFVNGAGQTAGINYGQTLGFTNLSGGTIVKNGLGTGSFVGNVANQQRGFVNSGTIIINAGVMKFDPRDAFSIGGFSNASSGLITIGNNATGMVTRTTNAWVNGSTVGNVGSVSIWGGAYVAQASDTGSLGNFTNVNSGVISGFGTLGWSVRNNAGTLLATGGVLNVGGQIIGAGGTFAAGGAGAGNSGTLLLIGGNAGGSAGTLTGNLIVTNGSAIIFAGDSDWTIGSAATVRFADNGETIAQRGSLISSNSVSGTRLFLANSAFIQNFGTLLVAHGGGINYGQIGADGIDMTNRLYMGGLGTFTGNFGTTNQALLNLGTISTFGANGVGANLLVIDPRDANHLGGFQNGLDTANGTGTVVIANGGTLCIRRSDAAWFSGGVSPTNFGTFNMQGGWLVATNTDFVPPTTKVDGGKFINAASGVFNITGTNVIDNFRVFQNNGLIAIGASANLTNNGNAGGVRGTFDNSSGVIAMSGSGSSTVPGAAILVTPNYVNTGSSAITNAGGGGNVLRFTGGAITNNGTMSFLVSQGAGGNQLFEMTAGANSNNFVRNAGTMIFGILGGANTSRAFGLSNQLVNAGTMILTNNSTSNSGSLQFNITGIAGTAFTNESTGTIRMIADGNGGGTGGRIAATVANGGFVNNGTITASQASGNAGTTSFINLADGSTFSNAVGGQVIVESGNNGVVDIQANVSVNLGTNIINAGTLLYENAAANNNVFTNKGVIIVNGGNISAASNLVNSNGLIRTTSGTGTLVASAAAGKVVNLSGATLEASAGTLVLLKGPTQQGSVTVTNSGTFQVGSASNVDWANAGSIFLSAGNIASGIVTNSGAASITGAGTIVGGTVINQNLATIESTNGRLIFAASLTNNGTINVRGGASGGTIQMGTSATSATFVLTNSTLGYINFFGGAIVDRDLVNAGHIASVNGGGLISNALINAAGAFIDATNGTLVLTPDLQNFGVITNGNGGTLQVGSTGNGTVTNSGAIALNDGNFFSGQLTNTGVIIGPGTVSGQVLNTAVGTVEATNGFLQLLSAPVQNGFIRVQDGASAGTLQVGTAGATDWANSGTITNRGGTILSGALTNVTGAGTITGFGTIAGALVNQNYVFVTNGVMFLTSATAPVNNGGTIDIDGGGANAGSLNVSTVWDNTGGQVLLKGGVVQGAQFNNAGTVTASAGTVAVVIRNSGTVDDTGTLTILNAAGSTVTNVAGGTYKAEGTALSILAAGGTTNSFRNAGTFILNNGTVAVRDFVNVGTFESAVAANNNATLNLSASSTAVGTFTNAGTVLVSGGGTGLVQGILVNTGLINAKASGVFGTSIAASPAPAGVFTNATGGTILDTNSAATLGVRANQGNFYNFGDIVVSNGATITLLNASGNGTWWTNFSGGRVFVGSVASDGNLNSGTLVNQGTINGSGTITLGYSTASNGRALFNDATGTLKTLDGRTLTISNLANPVIVGTLTNGQFYNTGTVIVGTSASQLNLVSGIAGAGFTNVNSGAILMNGGSLVYVGAAESLLTNASTGWITGSGTVTNAFIINTGTIFANSASPLVLAGSSLANSGVVTANVGRLVVNGTVNNSGTFAMVDSIGTFSSGVINSGAWITDPTTNVFQNTYTVTSAGYVRMSGSDVFIFTNGASAAADFVNLSSKSNQFDTLNGKFLFNNTLGLTQNFVVAGHDIGPGVGIVPPPNATNAVQFGHPEDPIFGFTNNFALGTLEISDFTTVRVTDAFLGLSGLGTNDGLMAGLYLNNLLMGLDSLLIISSNVEVYFKSSNTWDSSNFVMEGNPTFDNTFSGLHQLVVVPEPGVLFLWLCGIATAYVARRRSKKTPRG